MSGLLKGDLDVAQAMIYNEYAQVLEAKNPATGKLYTADDFSIIDWKTNGSAMLQDAAHREARSELVGAALDEKLYRIGHLVLPLRLCCNQRR